MREVSGLSPAVWWGAAWGRRALRLDMCRMHTDSAMLLGQVAAGEVTVDLEGGETGDFTYFWCAFEFNLTY